jgi:hypothetical protein
MDIKTLVKRGTYAKDLKKMLGGKIKLLNYRQLQKYSTIEDVLYPYDAVILLYETKIDRGHWVCVFNHNNLVEHFDSYGYSPDGELKFVPSYFRKTHYGKIPHLTELLYNSKKRVRFNEFRLQKLSKDVATCGRWVVARLLLKDLTIKQFRDLFRGKGIDSDILVTLFTQSLLE